MLSWTSSSARGLLSRFAGGVCPSAASSKTVLWMRSTLDPTKAVPSRVGSVKVNSKLNFGRLFLMRGMAAAAHSTVPPLEKIRNIAIIAHVDHGKTTLVDRILASGGSQVEERAMDSMVLEKERGITIMSKYTSLRWNGYLLNVVDTPGHQDFGGEVERILSMVEGVVLLVDATEGPMTQTKFVLTKALQRGLRPIVLFNKVDRDTARTDGSVENEVFELCLSLGATDEQMNFPILYASAREGWVIRAMNEPRNQGMTPLLEEIVKVVPVPKVNRDEPFRMLVTSVSSDNYVGRICTGKINSGYVRVGDTLGVLEMGKSTIKNEAKVMKLIHRVGMADEELQEAGAGDIVSICGIDGFVTETVVAPGVTTPIETIPIDPPTIAMTFAVNDSPLAGKEGTHLTSSAIKRWLNKEAENNVTIKLETNRLNADAIDVCGRGELQLGIIIERMRREDFELSISPPRVVFQTAADGTVMEPREEVMVDVPAIYVGSIIDKLSTRGGDMKDYKDIQGDFVRLQYIIPSRGLLGFRAEMKLATHGEATLHSTFHDYAPYVERNPRKPTPRLISMALGDTKAYALRDVEPRGILFVGPSEDVYPGMIIGNHSKSTDLEVNPTKGKKGSNIRTMMKDENILLAVPRRFSLEESILELQEDEVLEVTPRSVRLRKARFKSKSTAA